MTDLDPATDVLLAWLDEAVRDPKGFTPEALRLLCKQSAKKIRVLAEAAESHATALAELKHQHEPWTLHPGELP